MKPEYLAFLNEKATQNTPHEHGSLQEHLIGTYEKLVSWGCDEYVCDAGLFHSIYGTNIFRHKTIPYSERESVQKLIGKKAEELIYLFSTVERPGGFLRAIQDGYLIKTRTGKKITVSKEQLRELIEIECANLLEQGAGQDFFKQLDIHRADLTFGHMMWYAIDRKHKHVG